MRAPLEDFHDSLPGLCSPTNGQNVKSFKTGKLVARDGIEPPTPAFSGPDSYEPIMLIIKAKSRLNVLKTIHFMGQEWDKILAGQNCLSHCCPIPVLRVSNMSSASTLDRRRADRASVGRHCRYIPPT